MLYPSSTYSQWLKIVLNFVDQKKKKNFYFCCSRLNSKFSHICFWNKIKIFVPETWAICVAKMENKSVSDNKEWGLVESRNWEYKELIILCGLCYKQYLEEIHKNLCGKFSINTTDIKCIEYSMCWNIWEVVKMYNILNRKGLK